MQSKLLLWKHRYDEALEQARIAVSIAPEYGYAHFHLADVLVVSGWHEEAKRSIARARRLDPTEVGMMQTIASATDFLAGDSRSAKLNAEGAIARSPTFPWAHWWLAVAESDLGNYEAARAAARTARDLAPRMGAGFPQAGTCRFASSVIANGWRLRSRRSATGSVFPPYESDDTVVAIKPGPRVRTLRSGGDGGRG